LPSIETLVVPEAFRGHFNVLLPLMLSGLFCMGMIQYAINPIFQIEKKTVPMIAAAMAACAADPLLLLFLHLDDGASSLAIAQAGAMLIALIVLIMFASATWRQWPRPRDLAAVVFANALMGAIVLPMRGREPGLATLIEQAATGAAIYTFVVLGLDVAGLRGMVLARLRLTFARMKTL
jgi:small-conductance mechanosensitive channel